MNFKRIEMYGFKSFAEKIEIKFEKGITGIVGPNGCGKSNVADAVRWVLGEQSAKTLRGGTMMDVIFSGTEKRKSLSFCEVSLVFDNDDQILPIEFSEVVISRKLYRSGDSEYAINKTPCRLKDVVDLLRDIGIGKEGYSIIGQGKIDEVLSSKPDERRGIFEEACGISKFKARKLETERKLARTQENLIRINDIVVEIERQVEPLSKQSEDARKYLDFKENLKHHEINYYIYQYDSSNHFKNQILTKLNAINDEYNFKKSEYDKANESYNECLAAIDNVDKDISNLRDKQLELQVGLEKSSGEAKLTLERIRNLKANNEKMLADIKLYDLTHKAMKEKFGETKTAIDKNTKELENLCNTENRLSDDYLSIVDKINKIENEDIDNEKQVLDSLIKLSDIKSDISALTAEKKAHMEKGAEISKEKLALEKELKELNAQINESQKKIKEFSDRSSKLSVLKKQTLEDIKNNSEQYNQNNAEIKKFENYYASILSKEKMLLRLQDSFEGYQYSVRSLLTAAKTDVEISSKICGTVAGLMTVKQEYEIAIDVALGQTLQNVIVNHQSDAKVLIGYLKRKSLGRITFLPVDTIKGINDNYKHFSKIEGFLGMASDLISFDRKYQNIYTGLLSRTAVVDTYDNAINMARHINYQVKIVTLDGEIIHPFGSITGGSRKSESSSLLSLEREISDVKLDIINVKNKLEGHNEEIKKIESKKIKPQRRSPMKYEYITVTGKVAIEVDEQFNDLLVAMDNEEKNSNRKHSRRYPISLENCEYEGEWFEDKNNPINDTEAAVQWEQASAALTDLQRLC
ncbi:MAG: chromosome segregation protein SMC, partial [Firmicutes bacterium]|nr:chromosome segregation protein SMC [Bacillota bacterium]